MNQTVVLAYLNRIDKTLVEFGLSSDRSLLIVVFFVSLFLLFLALISIARQRTIRRELRGAASHIKRFGVHGSELSPIEIDNMGSRLDAVELQLENIVSDMHTIVEHLMQTANEQTPRRLAGGEDDVSPYFGNK